MGKTLKKKLTSISTTLLALLLTLVLVNGFSCNTSTHAVWDHGYYPGLDADSRCAGDALSFCNNLHLNLESWEPNNDTECHACCTTSCTSGYYNTDGDYRNGCEPQPGLGGNCTLVSCDQGPSSPCCGYKLSCLGGICAWGDGCGTGDWGCTGGVVGCHDACKTASTTACGTSLDNGCNTTCDNTGGTYCAIAGEVCDSVTKVCRVPPVACTETLISKTGMTTGATAYGGCGGNRFSCNVIDGAVTSSEADSWGSWECSQGNSLCSIWIDLPSSKRVSKIVVTHKPLDVPARYDVYFGDGVVYSGAANTIQTITDSAPELVNKITLTETQFPPGGYWWTIEEINFYEYQNYSTEVIDGVDNDCDGSIDEGGTTETCNGIDDDGDGVVDENVFSNSPPEQYHPNMDISNNKTNVFFNFGKSFSVGGIKLIWTDYADSCDSNIKLGLNDNNNVYYTGWKDVCTNLCDENNTKFNFNFPFTVANKIGFDVIASAGTCNKITVRDINVYYKCGYSPEVCDGTDNDGDGQIDENVCFCTGAIDVNAVVYAGDNVNLIASDLNTNVLVDANTARKCEWYCKSGYTRSGTMCVVQEQCNKIDDDLDGLIDEDACSCYKIDPPNGSVYSLGQTLGLNVYGLTNYWKLDGNFSDSKGSYDGIAIGSIQFATGKFIQSPNFTGTSFISAGPVPYPRTNNFSISAWFKLNALASVDGEDDGIVGRGKVDDQSGFALYVGGENSSELDKLTFRTQNSTAQGDAYTATVRAPTRINDTQWHHAVGVRNGNTYLLYLDGNKVAEVTKSNNFDIQNTDDFSKLFRIGSFRTDGHDKDSNINGLVDDVSYFNRVLSDCEIKQLALGPAACQVNCSSQYSCTGTIDGNAIVYAGDDVGLTASDLNTNVLVDSNTSRKCEWYCKSGYTRSGTMCVVQEQCNKIDDDLDGQIDEGACNCYDSVNDPKYPAQAVLGLNATGLVSYWPFDSNAGDYKSANNGTIFGGMTPSASKFGNGFSFNGSSQYITVEDNANLKFGTGNFSYCFWFKQPNYSGNSIYQLLSKRNLPAGDYEIQINTGSNLPSGLATYVYATYTDGVYKFSYPRPVSTSWSNWTHFCYVRDNNEKIYVDGVIRASSTAGTLVNVNSTAKLNFGRDSYQGDEFFNGSLDDVVIFNRGLSACEVKQLYGGPNACLPVCPTFSCVGSVDGNAVAFLDDNVGLTHFDLNTKILVDSDKNTSRKCEYYCKTGFYRSGNSCLPQRGLVCGGTMDPNSTMCGGTDTNLLVPSDWNVVGNLVSSCVGANKCSSYCNTNYLLQGGVCVLNPIYSTCSGSQPTTVIGMVKGPNIYLVASPPSPTDWGYKIDANIDTPCRWTCASGYIKQGNTCAVDTGEGIVDFNASYDGTIHVYASCVKDIMGQAKYMFSLSNGTYSKTIADGNCMFDGTWSEIIDQNLLIPGSVIQLSLLIPGGCDSCSKTIYLEIPKEENAAVIDDYSIITVLLLLVTITFILRKRE